MIAIALAALAITSPSDLNRPSARDAMARVAFAEAGNQGTSGLAGVVYTVLNRLSDGHWGNTVEDVVNAPGQFEPVMRAGGKWSNLPPVTAAQEARINTIVALAIEGRLPDLTGGARYFQNRDTVAARARTGQVSPSLIDFGGAAPSATIGAHTFYAEAKGLPHRSQHHSVAHSAAWRGWHSAITFTPSTQ